MQIFYMKLFTEAAAKKLPVLLFKISIEERFSCNKMKKSLNFLVKIFVNYFAFIKLYIDLNAWKVTYWAEFLLIVKTPGIAGARNVNNFSGIRYCEKFHTYRIANSTAHFADK